MNIQANNFKPSGFEGYFIYFSDATEALDEPRFEYTPPPPPPHTPHTLASPCGNFTSKKNESFFLSVSSYCESSSKWT